MTTKFKEFDVAKHLVDAELMAMFLSECLEEGGVDLFLDAIGEVARAAGRRVLQPARD
jgi:probable addiction module antidote protein